MAGSDKRQRSRQYSVRFTDAEAAELERKADAAGLSVAAYLRATALGSPGPRATRKPPIAKQELVRVLAQLGKIGSNVNQIARAINSGDDPHGLTDDIKAAVVAIAETQAATMRALGREPGRGAS